jgi:hypothetical protein
MTDQANVVPFGKYKGRVIDDPAYLQWLASQDWFRAKFVTLHQIIINRGAEPEETPEHNSLQVLFLDDTFCSQFVRRLYSDFEIIEINKSFEIRGADVELTMSVRYPEYGRCCGPTIRVEIKPAVGDDYPAVLRQMRRAESTVLFLEEYTGRGATREQFIQTFKTANIAVVFRDDLGP